MDGGSQVGEPMKTQFMTEFKMCQTVVGMSQVAARYQASQGKNLRNKLIGEMKDDKD